MKIYSRYFFPALAVALLSCSPSQESDVDVDTDAVAGTSHSERMAAMEEGGVGRLSAGRWQSRLSVTEIDMPSFARREKKDVIEELEAMGSHSVCINATQAMAPPQHFFAGKADDCRYGRFEVRKGAASIELSCDAASVGKVDMNLSGPISKDSYHMQADISLRLPVIGKVPVKAELKGEYKGSCETPDG